MSSVFEYVSAVSPTSAPFDNRPVMTVTPTNSDMIGDNVSQPTTSWDEPTDDVAAEDGQLPATNLINSVLCATLLLFGLFFLFYGYRAFKSVMFLTGFLFGTAVIYLICLSEGLLPLYGNVGVAAVAGFLFGLITMLVTYVGLFMLGFHLGLIMSVATLVVTYLVSPFIESDLIGPPSSAWIILAIFMSLGLTGACLNLYFQKGKEQSVSRFPFQSSKKFIPVKSSYDF